MCENPPACFFNIANDAAAFYLAVSWNNRDFQCDRMCLSPGWTGVYVYASIVLHVTMNKVIQCFNSRTPR